MKKVLYIVVVLLVAACNTEVVPKPEKQLSEQEMENILYDLALIQGIKSFKPDVLDKNGVDPRTYVYKKYSIDSLTLAQNHTWYASRLEEYEKMQKKVADRLKTEREKLNTTGKKTKPATTTPAVTTPAEKQEHRSRLMQQREAQMRQRNLDTGAK